MLSSLENRVKFYEDTIVDLEELQGQRGDELGGGGFAGSWSTDGAWWMYNELIYNCLKAKDKVKCDIRMLAL